jgi:hypothetical protein
MCVGTSLFFFGHLNINFVNGGSKQSLASAAARSSGKIGDFSLAMSYRKVASVRRPRR